MKSIEAWREHRRRSQADRLRREIAALQDQVEFKLSPDYDHDRIRQNVASITAKQRELAALTTQEVDRV